MIDLCAYKTITKNEIAGWYDTSEEIIGISLTVDTPRYEIQNLIKTNRKEVINNIKELNKKHGITVILITHYMDEAAEADRVVVMDKGKVIIEGVPRDVFSHVEAMKKIGLDVPQVTELAYELKKAGIDINEKILNVDEMVKELCQLK